MKIFWYGYPRNFKPSKINTLTVEQLHIMQEDYAFPGYGACK